MKIKDLIAKLEKFDPELPVYAFSEDEVWHTGGHLFRVLDIDDVDSADVERLRGDDRIPTVKLGKSEHSEKLVFINVTSDH